MLLWLIMMLMVSEWLVGIFILLYSLTFPEKKKSRFNEMFFGFTHKAERMKRSRVLLKALDVFREHPTDNPCLCDRRDGTATANDGYGKAWQLPKQNPPN